ncbi:MAG TPA: DUF4129 domain-containing protein [Candidatus Brocadiia bacterium]|nr:DUF4129 domain-containing protein [Candidatus Brocadiia bacterium]
MKLVRFSFIRRSAWQALLVIPTAMIFKVLSDETPATPPLKEHIKEILSRKEFAGAAEQDFSALMESYLREFFAWLSQSQVFGSMKAASDFAINALLIASIFAMALLIARIAVKRRNRNAFPGNKVRLPEKPFLGDPALLASQGDGAIGRGDFQDAIRFFHRAILAHLERRNVIRPGRTLTNGECLRQARRNLRDNPRLQDIAEAWRQFELAFYAGRPCAIETASMLRDMTARIISDV